MESIMQNFMDSMMNETVSYEDNDLAEFSNLSTNFEMYHKDTTNILVHMITTPLGIFGFLGLFMYATRSMTATSVLCLTYLLKLVASVPTGVFLGTMFFLVTCLFMARTARLGLVSSLGVIALAYVAQDLSHIITSEPTYQSAYSGGGHIDFSDLSSWSKMFMEHGFYLLPLCVDMFLRLIPIPATFSSLFSSPLPPTIQPVEDWLWLLLPIACWSVGNYCTDSKNGFCVFPGSPYFTRVITTNIATDPETDCESRKSDLATIRAWALKMMPPQNMSSHWWYRDLEVDEKAAFDRCAGSSHVVKAFRSLFSEQHYCLDIVDGMNEVYVTGPSRFGEGFNSDQIFYTKHVDGPFGLIPFVSVFRCIVGMDKNLMITTNYPMAEKKITAAEGDVVAFDFNREVHYITCDESKRAESDDYRVVLKLHYCVYPRILAPLGWFMHWANVQYNMAFRALFLRTINPKTPYERFLAWNVVFNTTLFNNIETYLGQRNAVYLMFAGLVWYCTGCYDWFLLATSFVHYFRYICTYYWRKDVDFGSFKRDVLLFKVLSITQVFGHYFFPSGSTPFQFDPISIAMIVIGYAVSVQSTKALGVDRTYFGAELGHCEPKWVTEFPYGYIPHPMIVSQVFALLGVLKADHFRESCPYLIHCHVVLYLTHMLQEHWDVWHDTMQKYFKAPKVKVI
mmetsp:Transcript_817/g.1373  ORF Transcript_817/g.1373 Transcript_817/m.1373 type:complete len:680 (-) Transcript_817:126-2165(-)|eukprot:CAMPEP_0185024736 /NCGR_PEP_ID=MMETSP1103-20130426/7920_1 /TAXON_ID=36769 /ORGANISM="Paraphysomonas bandaiensis, Strain Caron Lab Isolate" /LENGTH=679 /DNA_ID=CAMNT_0027557781 /DNA_START=95 /DNA_END=2134 /DNA_ORIENTATION=+